jgi:hypothetical protein
MSHRISLSRMGLASLAAAAIAAPTATAQPIDMHASTVKKPASQKQDLRTEAAVGATQAQPHTPGPPTWPQHPRSLAQSQAPVAVADGDGGGGIGDVPVPLIVIAGTLVLGAGAGLARVRHPVGPAPGGG